MSSLSEFRHQLKDFLPSLSYKLQETFPVKHFRHKFKGRSKTKKHPLLDWYGCLLNGPFTASYPYFQQLTLNKCSLSKLLMAIFEPGTAGVRCDCCVTTTALLRVPNSEILFKVEQNSRQKRPRLVNFNARLFKLGPCIFK